MKNQSKGITLVVLVITIIILLIIAGISIVALKGSGLLEKAQLATIKYSNSQVNEEVQIDKYANAMNSYISGSRDYETEINNLKAEVNNLKIEIDKLKNDNRYSMTEKIVGTWIDGKPLYKKTWDYGSILVVSNTIWTDTKISLSENNIDHVIKAEAVGEGTANDDCCFTIHAHTEDSVKNIMVLAARDGASLKGRYFTFYYTKTTDEVPIGQ